MTDLNQPLPCPFDGATPQMWDGRGTQAEIQCPECGSCQGVQVVDVLTYEERYGCDEGFLWNEARLSYGAKTVERARAELLARWNTRVPNPAMTVEDVNLIRKGLTLAYEWLSLEGTGAFTTSRSDTEESVLDGLHQLSALESRLSQEGA